jgi:hypothetical protein
VGRRGRGEAARAGSAALAWRPHGQLQQLQERRRPSSTRPRRAAAARPPPPLEKPPARRTCTSRCTSAMSSGVVSFRLLMLLHASFSPVFLSTTRRVVPNWPCPSTRRMSYTLLTSGVGLPRIRFWSNAASAPCGGRGRGEGGARSARLRRAARRVGAAPAAAAAGARGALGARARPRRPPGAAVAPRRPDRPRSRRRAPTAPHLARGEVLGDVPAGGGVHIARAARDALPHGALASGLRPAAAGGGGGAGARDRAGALPRATNAG